MSRGRGDSANRLAIVAMLAAVAMSSCDRSRGDDATVPKPAVILGSLNLPADVIQAWRLDAAKPRDELMNGGCGVGRMEAQDRARKVAEFFRSSQWAPVKVASRCARATPNATREARASGGEPEWTTARPALERCMQAGGLLGRLALALEIDEATGGVLASMVKDVGAESSTLQTCVAAALADLCFEPVDGGVLSKQLFSWFELDHEPPRNASPHAQVRQSQRERMEAAQWLTATASRCPARGDSPTAELPTIGELRVAFEQARPFIHQCMLDAGQTEALDIAMNVHGPTGRVVGAAAVTPTKNAALDACVADVLGWMCFLPFEAPTKTKPYWGVRERVPETRRPVHRFAQVSSDCPWQPTPSQREAPTSDELRAVLDGRLGAIRGCFGLSGLPPSADLRLEIEIDPRKGALIGTSAALADDDTRYAELDACVAGTLENVCVAPFRLRDGGGTFKALFFVDDRLRERGRSR